MIGSGVLAARGGELTPSTSPAVEQAVDEGVVLGRVASPLRVPSTALLPVASAVDDSQVLERLGAASATGADVLQGRPLARAGVEGDRAVADQALADPVAPGTGEGRVGLGHPVQLVDGRHRGEPSIGPGRAPVAVAVAAVDV